MSKRRRRPVVRLHHPSRLSPRARHRRHRVPAPDAAHGRTRSASSPASLIHALQNHDELTSNSCISGPRTPTSVTPSGAATWPGRARCARTSASRLPAPHGRRPPYNLLFTHQRRRLHDGVSSSRRRWASPTRRDHRRRHAPMIQKAHLLLAMYNAFQPGVFALSGWDLVGALTLPAERGGGVDRDGDTRWIERGALRPRGRRSGRPASSAGVPRGRSCTARCRTARGPRLVRIAAEATAVGARRQRHREPADPDPGRPKPRPARHGAQASRPDPTAR